MDVARKNAFRELQTCTDGQAGRGVQAQDFPLALGNALAATPAPAPAAATLSPAPQPALAAARPPAAPVSAQASAPAAAVTAQAAVPAAQLGTAQVAPLVAPQGAQPGQGCQLALGSAGQPMRFSSCRALTTDASALAFFWTLAPDAQARTAGYLGLMLWSLPHI